MLSSNISSTCPYNMVNFGQLVAEIDPIVRGTPVNFNGFRIYTSDSPMDFRTLWTKGRGLARIAQGCTLLGFVDMVPYLGVKSPETPILGS